MTSKLTNVERRRLHYRKLYGLDEKESTGNLRSDIRRWVDAADQEKKFKNSKSSNKYYSYGVDVNSIMENRLRYERANNVEEENNKGIGELLNNKND